MSRSVSEVSLGDKMVEPSGINSDYGIDLENRDPTNKNEHVRVMYEDAFAEPDGTHSIPGVWKCSFKTFKGVKNCCYIFLSVLCGGPCALMWGFMFGCQSFYHIWCYGPCYKSWTIDFGCCGVWWRNMVECCCDPVHDTIARVFSKIKFEHRYEVV